jgi:hypothetical protein
MRNLMRRSSGTSGSRSTVPCRTSTAHRIGDAGKFRQHAIAGVLDDAPSVFLDLWIDQFAGVPLQAFMRAFFIGAHQP